MTTKTLNRLANEKSPYLLQHAHNPVDWYPWGEDAFQKAKEQDKPIFLSIGYSTCHWCHVMAKESFTDEEVAAALNKDFIAIKVDKEERPDVDAVYMRVCQTLTGNGGWPLSIFLTPEQKPFLAGTYFPKNSAMNSIGFLDLLRYIGESWQNDRQRLLKNAEVITEHIGKGMEFTASHNGGETQIEAAIAALGEEFDDENGGFGFQPKFPTPQNILFLLERYETTKNAHLLEMAEKTLLQMYRGGMFDHIGGGFCRYSTDRFFLVPHFEKMLYDNALLTLCYAKAYEMTHQQLYKKIAEKTCAFIFREMTSPTGGFYAAQDADSEGEEGKYYLFTPAEIIRLLGEEKGQIFNKHYDITESGNFEGKNIPNLLQSDPFSGKDEEVLPILLNYRKKRAQLFTDDKILTAWNAMMIAALAVVYRVTGKEIYLQKAQSALRSIKEYASAGMTLLVGQIDGQGYGSGFLDDYAYYIFALLQLYEATLKENYLIEAEKFCDQAVTAYLDQEEGGFYLSGSDNEELIAPVKEVFDTALPCSNSVMTYNLLLLAELTKEERYQDLADAQIEFMKANVARSPVSACFFLLAFNRSLYPAKEIVCVGKESADCKSLPLRADLRATLLRKEPDESHPLLNDKPTYYICENGTCLPPTNYVPDIWER